MKKFLIFALAMSSYAASASVLLWLVDSSAESTVGTWTDAKVGYLASENHDSGPLKYIKIGGQAIDSSSWDYQLSSGDIAGIVEDDHFALADLSGITAGNPNSQYYFIELYNNGNLVGYTAKGVIGSALSDYIKEWSDLSNMTQSMTGWGGAPFTAVPEPTSGMLMLLGMALLGLRRKKAV